jgi:DNA-binding response OmpR family regulator
MLAYKVHHQIIDFIQYHEFYIVDEMDEMDDVTYYLKMRFYNLVLIYENDLKNCFKLLKILPNNNVTALVVLTENLSTKFELECLKNGAFDVIKSPYDRDLILSRLEVIHRKNFYRNVTIQNELFLDTEDKEVYDIYQNEINIRGKGFGILKYLAQNEHRRVTQEELIQVVWEEPELIRNNVVEVHMSLLKGQLKKHFHKEFIDNIKRKGYRLIMG